jgi:hypothetical protein
MPLLPVATRGAAAIEHADAFCHVHGKFSLGARMPQKKTPAPDIKSISAPSVPISYYTIYTGFWPKPPATEPRPAPRP